MWNVNHINCTYHQNDKIGVLHLGSAPKQNDRCKSESAFSKLALEDELQSTLLVYTAHTCDSFAQLAHSVRD